MVYVYLSFSIYSGIYESIINQIQKSNYSGGLSDVLTFYLLLIICSNVFFVRYLFSNYFNEKLRNYNILQMIGGTKKVVVSFLTFEFLFIVIITTLVAQVLNICIMLVLRPILNINNLAIYPPAYVNIIFWIAVICSALISLIGILKNKRIRNRRRISNFFEKWNSTIRNIFSGVFLCVGVVLCGWSVYLLLRYNVPNMFLSILIALLGILFISSSAVPIISKIIRKHERFYYNHVIIINNYMTRIKSNNLVFRVLVIMNFAVIFIIGSLFATYISLNLDNLDDIRFPYEQVIVTSIIDIEERVSILTGNEFPGTLINQNDYNRITKSQISLKDNEVIYITQRLEDESSGLPYGDDLLEIFIEGNYEYYNIEEQDYRIIFGEYLSRELLDIIIVSPDTFVRLKNSNESEEFSIVLFQEQPPNEESFWPSDTLIFNKKDILLAQKIEQKFILFTILSLGFTALISCWFFVYIKLRAEYSKTIEHYRFLEIMGIKVKELIKLSLKEIKLIIAPGLIIGYLWGIFDFCIVLLNISNINEYKSMYQLFALYIIAVSMIQICFYMCLRRYFKKEYKDKIFNIDRKEVVNFESI